MKPKLNRNQYGFVFGGPIVRNRTFFFADYEGFRQVSKSVTFATIPTMAQQQGILGRRDRQPVDRRVVSGRRDSHERNDLVRARGARRPARADPARHVEQLRLAARREDFNDKYNIKVDHQFSSRMTMFGRYSFRNVDNFEPPPIPGETGSPSNAFVHVKNRQGAAGFTFTVTPTSLLEVRLGVSSTKAGKEPPGISGPNMFDLYGITGLPTDPRFAGGLTEQGVGGLTAWGRQNSNPQFQDPSVSVWRRCSPCFLIRNATWQSLSMSSVARWEWSRWRTFWKRWWARSRTSLITNSLSSRRFRKMSTW